MNFKGKYFVLQVLKVTFVVRKSRNKLKQHT